MGSGTIGWGLTGLGAVLVAIGALADPLGIGGHPDFGWKQILAVVVGLLVIVAGQYWLRKGGSGGAA